MGQLGPTLVPASPVGVDLAPGAGAGVFFLGLALERVAAGGHHPSFGCPSDVSTILPLGDDCCGEPPLAGQVVWSVGGTSVHRTLHQAPHPAQSDGGDTQSPELRAPASGCWRPDHSKGWHGCTKARVEQLIQHPKLPFGYVVQASHRASPKGLALG